jgi:PPOX class probable F420-dependent enzyme
MADFDDVRRLAGSEQGLCVVATTRTDGSVHGSVVNAGPMQHPITGAEVVAFVVRSDARKLQHFVRSGRASLTFRRGWRWVGVEGPVDVIGPEGAETPGLLQEVFRAAGGDHEDWDEFDRVMAAERRVGVFLHPERIFGQP